MCWFRRRLSSSVSGVCRCSTTMIRGNCSRVRLICSVCGVFVVLVCLIILSLSEMVFSFDIYWVSASYSPYPQTIISFISTNTLKQTILLSTTPVAAPLPAAASSAHNTPDPCCPRTSHTHFPPPRDTPAYTADSPPLDMIVFPLPPASSDTPNTA